MEPDPVRLVHETQDLDSRFRSLMVVAVAVMAVLLLRLWYLQVYKGAYYYELSKNNRIRLRYLMPLRGRILDREGRVLVTNRPSFNLYVDPEYVRDPEGLARLLSPLVQMSPKEILNRLKHGTRSESSRRIRIKSNLSWTELCRVESRRFELRGVSVQAEPKRWYVHPGLACHLIGYLGEISEKELSSKEFANARIGETVGKRGIEKVLQPLLRGRKGARHVEVDAGGREIKTLVQVDALPGNNVYLTIDMKLQEVVEAQLKGRVGAIVAMDPRTGEILAMASSPGFDENLFVEGISFKEWQAIRDHPHHPLQNRAIQGQYPPGSIFKIVTALAGLSEGAITPKTVIECRGRYKLGRGVFRCWKPWGHGRVDLERALAESCDIYFYHLGRKLGVDTLARYARQFGFGEKTGVLLDSERPGLVPTSAWKRRRYGIPWQMGETLSTAIGQSYLLVTPLQTAVFISAVANGGSVLVPSLVRRIETSEGIVTRIFEPRIRRKVPIRKEYLDVISGALQRAVEDAAGTAKRCRIRGLTVAGKTGTVQVVGNRKKKGGKNGEDPPYLFRDHAWFVCYAPVSHPRIALAILVEHSGHGGAVAAPMAKRILEAWIKEGGGLVSPPRTARLHGARAE